MPCNFSNDFGDKCRGSLWTNAFFSKLTHRQPTLPTSFWFSARRRRRRRTAWGRPSTCSRGRPCWGWTWWWWLSRLGSMWPTGTWDVVGAPPCGTISFCWLCRMTWLYINNNAIEHWTSTLIRLKHGKSLFLSYFHRTCILPKTMSWII